MYPAVKVEWQWIFLGDTVDYAEINIIIIIMVVYQAIYFLYDSSYDLST